MIKTLYIFSPTFDVSTVLEDSTLLTSKPPALEKSRYHTSVGDMSAADIISISELFDKVELIDQGFDYDSPTWFETKILLNHLSHRRPVENFTRQPPETFVLESNVRSTTEHRKLWVFGCSHSHGVGLKLPEQRFGRIVSQQLNLHSIFVTQPGSSLQWSLRHLVNSNISNKDVVIWQITAPQRLTLYNGNATEELRLAVAKNKCLLEVFNDQQIFFHHCSLLNYGVNYLRAKKAKFVLVSILNQQQLFYRYLDEYTKYPEYCYTPDSCLDLGTDRLHLGPLSHKAIAHRILDHIQLLNE